MVAISRRRLLAVPWLLAAPAVSRPALSAEPPAPPELFARYSQLTERLPWVALGRFPTPVQRFAELGARIGVPALYVKRDDLSAAPYGGGKVRKLEPLLGRALARGARTVVTSGGVGSHHALASAVYARRLGLACQLWLLPEPATDAVRSVLAADLEFGAELHLGRGALHAESAMQRFAHEHPGATVLPPGGSSPLGNLGFVNAGLELAGQVARGELPAPDDAFVALGTMGSAAGLALGMSLAGLSTRVVAVRASNPGTSSATRLRRAYADTLRHLRSLAPDVPDVPLDEHRLMIDGSALGRGYALPTSAGTTATALAREAGLELDPTYTAKTLAALIARRGELARRSVLLWQSHAPAPPAPTFDARSLPKELRGYFPRGGRGS